MAELSPEPNATPEKTPEDAAESVDPVASDDGFGDAFDDVVDEDAPVEPDAESALSEALAEVDAGEIEHDSSDDALTGDANGASPNAAKPKRKKLKAVLCPYCGHTQKQRPGEPVRADGRVVGQRCDTCGGLFEPLSRKATQIAMGPWYLRDKRNPFRPGCSFDVVEKLIKLGQIGPTTVMRGPTTRQFWSIARNIAGVSHRLGFCHACGAKFDPDDEPTHCPICEVEFKTPKHRNELGLAYPNRRAAESAQRSLDRQLALLQGKDLVGIDPDGEPVDHHPDPPPKPKPEPEPSPPKRKADPSDLLGDVLGIETPPASRPADVSALDFAPDALEDAEPYAANGSGVGWPTPAAPPATVTPQVPPTYEPAPAYHEPPAAAPIAAPHPNQLVATRPAQPWVVYLLVALNVIVGLGILGYFLFQPGS